MMTMFRGSIVEQGPVGQLLTNLSHDYTKLLLASVPVPDPDQRWKDRVVITDGRPRVVAEADLVAVPAQYGPSGPQGGTSA
jgi:ABC-type oligopeptide transport system ATPase subunit